MNVYDVISALTSKKFQDLKLKWILETAQICQGCKILTDRYIKYQSLPRLFETFTSDVLINSLHVSIVLFLGYGR